MSQTLITHGTGRRPRLFLIALLFCLARVGAAGEVGGTEDPDWRFTLIFGPGDWSSQEDLSIGGSTVFDSGPYALGVGVGRRVAELGDSDLYIGLDAGVLRTDVNLPARHDVRASHTVIFAPSVALYFDDPDARRLNVRAALGYYSADYDGVDDLTSLDRSFSESALGGFVGAGVDFPLELGSGMNSFVLDVRVHFVDFGDVAQPGPTPTRLHGPIWTFQFGWARRF